MKPLIATLVLLLAGTVGAQTANVIDLDPADTARANAGWTAKQKADAEWEYIKRSIGDKYVNVRQSNLCRSGISPCAKGDIIKEPRPGFENGFDLSTDFKHIVAKESPMPMPTPNSQFIGTNDVDTRGTCTIPTMGR